MNTIYLAVSVFPMKVTEKYETKKNLKHINPFSLYQVVQGIWILLLLLFFNPFYFYIAKRGQSQIIGIMCLLIMLSLCTTSPHAHPSTATSESNPLVTIMHLSWKYNR